MKLSKKIQIVTTFSLVLLMAVFSENSKAVPSKPITTHDGIGLIKIDYTSGYDKVAEGRAILRNLTNKETSAKFEIKILNSENKEIFRLYSKKIDFKKREEKTVVFKAVKEKLPKSRFIFHFETIRK